MDNLEQNNLTDTKDIKKQIIISYILNSPNPFKTLTVKDVSEDLNIGINQAYELFNTQQFPSINIGKRKVITNAAYLLWKMTGNKECD